MKSEEQEELRVCAFIDTLGTSDIFLNNTTGKKQELIRLIRKLVERNASHSMNTQNLGLGLVSSPTPQITAFSDNIAISFPLTPIYQTIQYGNESQRIAHGPENFASALLTQIISIVWEALRYGILFRGSICVGNLFHDDQVICGDALVKAAYLEKKTEYPRIEIQKEVLALKKDDGKPLFNDYLSSCIEEYDGRFFLDTYGYHELIFMDHNYFQERDGNPTTKDKRDILRFYSDKISREYEAILKSGNNKVIEKWDWFIDELERKFKTSDIWQKLDDSFDSMFNLIKERTDWKEKIKTTTNNGYKA